MTNESITPTLEQGIQEYQSQNHQKAADIFEEIVTADSKAWPAWRMLGFAHLALKNFEKAISAFETAIQLNEQDADNHFGLACAFQDSNNHAKAISSFETTLQKNPQHPAVKSKSVLSYLQRGDELMANANLMGAEQYFEKAHKYAQTEETYNKLIDYLSKAGQSGKISLVTQEWNARHAPVATPAPVQETTQVMAPVNNQPATGHMATAHQAANANSDFLNSVTKRPDAANIQQTAAGNFIPCPMCKKPMGIHGTICPHCSHDIRKPTNSNFTSMKSQANRITWQELTYKIICVVWALAGVFGIVAAHFAKQAAIAAAATAGPDDLFAQINVQSAEQEMTFAIIFGAIRIAVGVGLLFEISVLMWIGYVMCLINIFNYGMGVIIGLGLMTINPATGAVVFLGNAVMLALTGLFVYLLRFLGDI